MARKKNKGKGKSKGHRPNSHEDPAVALCYDCGEKTYVVLDIRAHIVAVIQEDRRGGWGQLHERGYGDVPIFGPIEVSPEIVEEINSMGRRELNVMGPILAGTIGTPIAGYLDGKWGPGKTNATAYNPVEVKDKQGRSQPYGGELRTSVGELAQVKARLLRKK